jgi:hypothetical protein
MGSRSRRWLNQSTHSKVAYSTSSMPFQGPRRRTSSTLYRPMMVSASALMPLCQGFLRTRSGRCERAAELGEDLPGDVALEQPDDLLAAGPVGGAAGGVGAGLRVVHQPVGGNRPQCTVGGTVTAAVQPVALGLAAGMLDRADTTERGERRLAVEPVGVVAGGDQQLGGADRTDAGPGQQPRSDLANDRLEWRSLSATSPSRCCQRPAKARRATLVPSPPGRAAQAAVRSAMRRRSTWARWGRAVPG